MIDLDISANAIAETFGTELELCDLDGGGLGETAASSTDCWNFDEELSREDEAELDRALPARTGAWQCDACSNIELVH